MKEIRFEGFKSDLINRKKGREKMVRYLKMLALGMVVIGLMASSVFAGTITFFTAGGANSPANIALEALGAVRNFVITGDGAVNNGANAALQTTTTTPLISGDMLTISFTNVGFDGSLVSICKATANVVANTAVASDTPTGNATSWAFRLTSAVAALDAMFVTNSGDGTNCNVSTKVLQIKFPAISSAAMASVSVSAATSGGAGISGANASAKNFANIARQYTTAYAANNSTIDFATNSTSNGAHFVLAGASTNSAVSGMANIANNAGMNLTAPGSGLTVSALLSLQDSANWQGVQRVFVNQGDCTANNAVNNAVNSLSGTINLSIPAAGFSGNAANASYAANVCVDVKGNAALQSRTIKAAYDINVGTGGNDPALDTYTTVMSWTPNGYQGIVPYMNTQSIYATICFINNKSTLTGAVTADILTSESGATLTSLSGLALGTLAALGTMRVDFASSITPYTYSGGVETAGTAVPLTGLQENDRYSVLINVGAAPSQVTVNCIQLDPAGSKRAVPVLTQIGASNPYQQ